MLNIITKIPNQIDIFEEWKLGDTKSPNVRGLHPTALLHVVATNRELNWIRANVSGIRMHSGNQVRWIGEDAVFILNALPKPQELEGVWL